MPNASRLSDVLDTAPGERCPCGLWLVLQLWGLRAGVAALVQAAAGQLRYAQHESPQQRKADEPTDSVGVQTAVTKLCTPQRVRSAWHGGGHRGA